MDLEEISEDYEELSKEYKKLEVCESEFDRGSETIL